MVEISKNKLSELIINPKQISLEDTFALNDIIKEYPYFQAGRILELIGLKKHNSIRFNKVLKDCSLFSNDRGVLRDIIELDEIVVKRKNNKSNDVILSSQKTKNSFIEWLKVTKPVFKEKNSKNETLIQDFLKSKPIISLKSNFLYLSNCLWSLISYVWFSLKQKTFELNFRLVFKYSAHLSQFVVPRYSFLK